MFSWLLQVTLAMCLLLLSFLKAEIGYLNPRGFFCNFLPVLEFWSEGGKFALASGLTGILWTNSLALLPINWEPK